MFTVEKGVRWWVERVTGSRVVLFMHMHAHTSLSMSGDALEARWSGGAMVGMLGTTVPSSPLWVLGWRFLHRGCCGGRACWSCCAARLSPVGLFLFLFLFRVVSMLLRSLPMRLRRVGVVGGGVPRCVRCVVHLLLLWLQVLQWLRCVARRVTTLVHMLVLDGQWLWLLGPRSGVLRVLRRWQGPVP